MEVRCNALGAERSDELQSEGVGGGARLSGCFEGCGPVQMVGSAPWPQMLVLDQITAG